MSTINAVVKAYKNQLAKDGESLANIYKDILSAYIKENLNLNDYDLLANIIAALMPIRQENFQRYGVRLQNQQRS